MMALPAYTVSKVGRSGLRVLLILLAVTIMQYYLDGRTAPRTMAMDTFR